MQPEDAPEKELSVLRGFSVLIHYSIGKGDPKVWVDTKENWSSTSILLSKEFWHAWRANPYRIIWFMADSQSLDPGSNPGPAAPHKAHFAGLFLRSA